MASATATVPTQSGSKYMQQLCKHWSHKLEVEFDADKGVVKFPAPATVTMVGEAEALVVTIEANDAETVDRMKGVISSHLDRFAFREAPLPFSWA